MTFKPLILYQRLRLPRYIIADDGKSITCSRCGFTSYNVNDVNQRYCGNCHVFHDDDPPRNRRGVNA